MAGRKLWVMMRSVAHRRSHTIPALSRRHDTTSSVHLGLWELLLMMLARGRVTSATWVLGLSEASRSRVQLLLCGLWRGRSIVLLSLVISTGSSGWRWLIIVLDCHRRGPIWWFCYISSELMLLLGRLAKLHQLSEFLLGWLGRGLDPSLLGIHWVRIVPIWWNPTSLKGIWSLRYP